MRVEPKPKPGVEIVTSRVAYEKHQNRIEAWGEAGWAVVARQCRFWRELGMPLPFECPSPTATGEDPETHEGERR